MDKHGFKWNIGDVVAHIGETIEPPEKDPLWGMRTQPVRYHIVERAFQECPGGIQRQYLCRSFRPGVGTGSGENLVRYNEIELMDPPPVKPEERYGGNDDRR